jgi:probable HAF family extracellular repeat protein
MKRAFILAAFAAGLAATAQSTQSYTVTVLDTAPGSGSSAHAINDLGQIVGFHNVGSESAPCVWDADGTSHVFGLPGGVRGAWGSDINNAGDVIGTTYDPNVGFLFQGGTWTWLQPGTGAAYAEAINDFGVAVGTVGNQSAYLRPDGYSLISTGYTYSQARDINNGGQVVGSASTGTGGYAYIAGPGGFTLLGSDLYGSAAYAANELGQVAGEAYVAQGTGGQAALFAGGQTTILAPAGLYSQSRAYGINDAGVVVGDFSVAGQNGCGFVYRDGQMLDLNDLVGPAFAGHIMGAYDVNENGWIVGFARFDDGGPNQVERAILLRPVPEPATMAGLLVGLGWLVSRRRRKS